WGLAQPAAAARPALAAGLSTGLAATTFELPPNGRLRKVFSLRPALQEGTAELTFAGKADAFRDAVREKVRVVPDGFPVAGSYSDLLEGSATHKVVLPRDWIKGTLHCRVDVYPSTLADLQKGLAGLPRDPYGCFEQASTANYPNTLILSYLRETDQANPAMEKQARQKLAAGYQRLTSYECQKPGARGQESGVS